jgi:hypothetical protein
MNIFRNGGKCSVSFLVLDAIGMAWLIDTKGTYGYMISMCIYMHLCIYVYLYMHIYVYIYVYVGFHRQDMAHRYKR